MTTLPAMPELPEPELGYIETDKSRQPAFSARQMRAALQAQPAEVSDAEIDAVTLEQWGPDAIRAAHRQYARAILALRPQSESAAPTVEAAREMGAKGGPVVEAERLAFEAWMAGHCWAVSPTWNGKTYDDSEEDKKRKLLDPLARTTRMLWAAWRDRAALSSLRPQAVPMTGKKARRLSREELAGCCGGCASNSAIETWMRRAIEKFCEVNGITAPAGGEKQA